MRRPRQLRFQRRQNAISLERNREFLGRTVEVMMESRTASGMQGRTGSNHIVHFKGPDELRPGDIAQVIISHAGQHSLQGTAEER